MAQRVRTVIFLFMRYSSPAALLVAVGTALASGPPHRSVREGLPHTALTSGSCDGQPLSLPYMSTLRPSAFFDRPALPSSVGVCRASDSRAWSFPTCLGLWS